VAPYVRDSQDSLKARLPDAADSPKPAVERPEPSHKQTFGTLDGKAAAISHVAQPVAQGEHPQLVHRVALTDGGEALQQQRLDQLPTFTLVLDIIHATEYLCEAANACWGETAAQRLPWGQPALSWLLDNRLDTLLNHLDAQAIALPPAQQLTLARVSAYLRRNRPFMDYPRYLAQDWPLDTGLVEGACRHLVKDPFEQAGRR